MVDILIKNRLLYRITQFLSAIFSRLDAVQMDRVKQVLNPDQVGLFIQLQNSEQIHAFKIFEEIDKLGITNTDHLKIALLHDIGKIVHPLSIFERVMIVVWKKIYPHGMDNLKESDLKGWKRGLVIAKKHPAWGADLVSNTSVSENFVDIIRYHHSDEIDEQLNSESRKFLSVLKSIDDVN